MTPKRVLITGATGFVGSHLAEYVLREHPEVELYFTKRLRSPLDNLIHAGVLKTFYGNPIFFSDHVNCDLKDPHDVQALLEWAKPDWIFHLAAQSFVPTSWQQPTETMATNVNSTINLFETMRKMGLKDTRIQIAGSSEEYGLVYPEETPIKETNPLRPLSPYAVSKVAQDLLAFQYHRSYGLHTIRTRAFNHEGPRRGEAFVTSTFAKQVAEVELGMRKEIRHGNLDAQRDFTDVRDVVRAYWMLMEKGVPGEVYNICSGRAWVMRTVLEYLLLASNAKQANLIQDPERMRPSDVPILLGDYSKLYEATGWQPEIKFEKTLVDLLDYWRGRLKNAAKV